MQKHECSWQNSDAGASTLDGTRWPLETCAGCGLVRLSKFPSAEEAYPPDYYGRGESKFLPGIERLSHAPPTLLPAAVRLACSSSEQGVPHRILDVGCGRGYLLRQFQAMGWLASGIDIKGSPVPVGDPQLDCREGDACSLPWPSEHFDLVVLNHVLEHVADPWRACTEAARVLRPEGILYVGVPNYGSIQRRLFGTKWFPLEIPRHLYHFTPTSLRTLTEAAGYTVLRQSTRSYRQGLFGFIQSALNALDPGYPDLLLSLLKGRPRGSTVRTLMHLAVGVSFAPFAFLECSLAWALGRGSVVVLVCRKRPSA